MAELGSFRHMPAHRRLKLFFETTPCKVAGANAAAHYRLENRISHSVNSLSGELLHYAAQAVTYSFVERRFDPSGGALARSSWCAIAACNFPKSFCAGNHTAAKLIFFATLYTC
jgi:hypothetical protein